MDSPPKGLRWRDEGPLAATLRPAMSRLYLAVAGAVWNGTIGGVVFPSRPGGPFFEVVAAIAVVGFALLAVREAFLVTRVTFTPTVFRVAAGLLAPWVRLELPLAAVRGFGVTENRDGTFGVEAVLSDGGGSERVPLNWEGPPFKGSWTTKRLFAAPVSHASFVAERCTAMLDAARRSGHETYRS